MGRKVKIRLKELAALETEFHQLLVACLRECAEGRWGLFGANDRFSEFGQYFHWPEKDRLHELATSIQAIRAEWGDCNPLCNEFVNLCALHRANDPGEPKLAISFLKRIEEQNESLMPQRD